MLNPTKKQLADPTYWDKNAPEGATHFKEDDDHTYEQWVKITDNQVYRHNLRGLWIVWKSGCEHFSEFISRPPSLPFDIGSKVEAEVNSEWVDGEVAAVLDDGTIFIVKHGQQNYSGFTIDQLRRPIAEVRRDEIYSEIVNDLPELIKSEEFSESVRAAIGLLIDKGYVKIGQEDLPDHPVNWQVGGYLELLSKEWVDMTTGKKYKIDYKLDQCCVGLKDDVDEVRVVNFVEWPDYVKDFKYHKPDKENK